MPIPDPNRAKTTAPDSPNPPDHGTDHGTDHAVPATMTKLTGNLQHLDLSELCEKCSPIFKRLPQVGRNLYYGTLVDCEDFRHWDSQKDLKASASQGCRLCILFAHGLRESGPQWTYFGPVPKAYRNVGIVRAQKRDPKPGGEDKKSKWPAIWDLNLHIPGEVTEPGNGLFSFVELKRLGDDLGMSSLTTQMETGNH